MVRRTCLHLLELTAGLVAGVAIVFVLAVWRLSQGPVSVEFLTPYAEEMLSAPERGLQFEISDTILTWSGWPRGIDVRVLGVSVVGPGGAAVGHLPELAIEVSGRALARGVLAPSTIDLFGPELTLRRTRDGSFEIGLAPVAGDPSTGAAADGDVLHRLLARLGERGDRNDPLDYLERVNVLDAEVILDDQVLEKTWRAPASYISIEHHDYGLRAEASVSVSLAEGPATALDISGTYDTERRQADVVVNFDDLSPAAIAELVPGPVPPQITAMDLPFSGTAAFGVDVEGTFDTVGLVLRGGAGTLELPAPLAQRVAVERSLLRATYDARDRSLQVDELALSFAEGARIDFPAPIDHGYDVRQLDAKLKADLHTQRLEIQALDIVLANGLRVGASAVIDGFGFDGGAMSIDVKAETADVAVNDVARLWPRAIADDAYDWVTQHLSEGTSPHASMEARLWSAEGGGIEVVSLSGEIRAEGVTVDYLPPMPPATDVAADMRFDTRQFEIWLESGTAPGLTLRRGSVHLTQLDTDDEQADINLAIDGSVRDALELIDHQPLEFAQAQGVDPKTAAGQAEISLQLSLPLREDLTFTEVRVQAQALLEDTRFDSRILGRYVSDGDLRLEVDNERLNLRGKAEIAGLPMNLQITDNFSDTAEFRTRYELATTFDKVSQLTDLGIDLSPLDDQMLSGAVGTRVRFTQIDATTGRIEAEADLTQARVEIPELEWSKPIGVPGDARFTVSLAHDLITAIPRFEVSAGDLIAEGSADYAPAGTGLERIDFNRLAFGRNDVKGALIARADGGWEVGLEGKALDLAPYWEKIKSPEPNVRDPDSFSADLTILAEIDRIFLDEGRVIEGVSATAARRNDLWRTVALTGRLDGEVPIDFKIEPTGPAVRRLSLTTPNAGRTLAFFDLYDGMVGGRLAISGTYDDAAIGHPLRGRAQVTDYRIVDAPLMARVLSIMALTGVLDAMQGDGLAFDELQLPFTLTNGTLEIANAHAAGRSLGFTASGKVYTHAEVVDLTGTVVPAYAVNSVLGRIPLLGDILTGPEAGGGVFAANFSMTGSMDDPTVRVNPLSALTPGVLRGIFGFLGGAEIADDKTGTDDLRPATPGQ